MKPTSSGIYLNHVEAAALRDLLAWAEACAPEHERIEASRLTGELRVSIGVYQDLRARANRRQKESRRHTVGVGREDQS